VIKKNRVQTFINYFYAIVSMLTCAYRRFKKKRKRTTYRLPMESTDDWHVNHMSENEIELLNRLEEENR
jgi:hypothetical protein